MQWLKEFEKAARKVYEQYVPYRTWSRPSRRVEGLPGYVYRPLYSLYGVETFVLLDVGTLGPAVLRDVASKVMKVMHQYSIDFVIIQFADNIKAVQQLARPTSLNNLNIASCPVASSFLDPALREVKKRACVAVPGKGADAVIVVTSGSLQLGDEGVWLARDYLPLHTGFRALLHTGGLNVQAVPGGHTVDARDVFRSWVRIRVANNPLPSGPGNASSRPPSVQRCPRCGLDVSHISGLSLRELYARIVDWHKTVGLALVRHVPTVGWYKNRYIQLLLDLPCPDAASVEDIALVSWHTMVGLLEWSFWLPTYDRVYNHCYAALIVERLGGWERTRELASRSPLFGRHPMAEPQKTSSVHFSIPAWDPPSIVAIAKEYVIAHSMACPLCFEGKLTFVQQRLLSEPGRVIAGDQLILECQSCHSQVDLHFHFRDPLPCEDLVQEALCALAHVLDVTSSGEAQDPCYL